MMICMSCELVSMYVTTTPMLAMSIYIVMFSGEMEENMTIFMQKTNQLFIL